MNQRNTGHLMRRLIRKRRMLEGCLAQRYDGVSRKVISFIRPGKEVKAEQLLREIKPIIAKIQVFMDSGDGSEEPVADPDFDPSYDTPYPVDGGYGVCHVYENEIVEEPEIELPPMTDDELVRALGEQVMGWKRGTVWEKDGEFVAPIEWNPLNDDRDCCAVWDQIASKRFRGGCTYGGWYWDAFFEDEFSGKRAWSKYYVANEMGQGPARRRSICEAAIWVVQYKTLKY